VSVSRKEVFHKHLPQYSAAVACETSNRQFTRNFPTMTFHTSALFPLKLHVLSITVRYSTIQTTVRRFTEYYTPTNALIVYHILV